MGRPLVLVLGSVFLILAAVPTGAAHVTVTAETPAGPIPWGQPTAIPVTFSASCATVLAEYEVAGNTELEIVLKEGAPTWVNGTGEKIPFSFEMCDAASATVESTGNLIIVPSELAPGLQSVNITAVAKGEAGEVNIPIVVAYRGEIQGPTSSPEIELEHGNATAEITLGASLNADSFAMVEIVAEPEHGTLTLPEGMLEVASTLADGSANRTFSFPIGYHALPGANFTMDMATIRVFLHAASDPSQQGVAQEFMVHFAMPDHEMGHMGEHEGEGDAHDHDSHDHDAASVPAIDGIVGLLGVVLAGFVLRRRN